MNRIRLLPEQVANQIAAGEVVERPASVVKELVENSLDAEAQNISVEIQAGGRGLIRVLDDGCGMSRDDALLCLERHATSKLRRAEDLAAISTMGFRGEALPSIASVSRFTLISRERESGSPEGTRVFVNGGKIVEVKAAGCAAGTTVEVRQIFFNLPARRKFLRSEETESAHIQHYLTLAALAFPEVAFTFVKDGRIAWQWPAVKLAESTGGRHEALRERLRAVYGQEQMLLSLDAAADLTPAAELEDELQHPSQDETPDGQRSERGLVRLWGFIGGPGVSRATREDQHLFVNRRPVENRGLNYALLEGYHTALMKGRYPVACLFLELAPAAVDVNIHPAKREVKFRRETDVRRFVAQAVRQTLAHFHGSSRQRTEVRIPATGDRGQVTANRPPVGTQPGLPSFPVALAPLSSTQLTPPSQPPLRLGFGRHETSSAAPAARAEIPDAAAPHLPRPISTQGLSPNSETETQNPPKIAGPEKLPASGPVPLLDVPLRLIGVVGNLYVLLESDRGLVLLDQHAAHERILFEQMLARLEEKEQAPTQRLLLPETVELSSRDAAFLRGQLSVLGRLGVGLSDFGERTFLLDTLPPFVKTNEPRRFVLELVDELKAAGEEVNTMRLGEAVVAKTVCRHAVKAHDPLSGPELENLVAQLRHCRMPYTCPHGRPTLIEMNFRELEKKFGRVQ